MTCAWNAATSSPTLGIRSNKSRSLLEVGLDRTGQDRVKGESLHYAPIVRYILSQKPS